MDEPPVAFAVDRAAGGVEVRVNFGVFAGRPATAAEINRLADQLVAVVGDVSIVAEERHEVGARGEATVHQIRIEAAGGDAAAIVERASAWARLCVAERHADVTDGA
ncbi:MAG TPA: hypothetical protein VGC78_04470 [Gaiellaceae bacterium]|jgi:hypothetical protein